MFEVTIPRQMGLQVRKARTERGLSQKELARRAGVSERLVLSLELGDAPGIRLDKLMSVTRALGIRLYVDLPERTDVGAVGQASPDPSQKPNQTPAQDGDNDSLESYQRLYDQIAQVIERGPET